MVKKKNHEEENELNTNGDTVPENQDFIENQSDSQTETTEENLSETKVDETEEYKQKLTEMQDKYLRLTAEFDNYRKRTLREKIELTKSAGESVIISILPVVDDFDLAMGSLNETEDCSAIKEGINLIYNKLQAFLKQNGVKEMEAMLAAFDSEIHEAVTKIPVEDETMKGKIIDIIRKGYTLNDKVIRFPKVVVGE